VATGAGVIGAQLGLQPHQFGGFWNSAAIDGAQIAPSGGFRGFFTNPGGAAGVPAGAAFTYTIGDPATGVSVDGAAVFRKP
jgi:hypothetical protein